jgi:hypothetical protein
MSMRVFDEGFDVLSLVSTVFAGVMVARALALLAVAHLTPDLPPAPAPPPPPE